MNTENYTTTQKAIMFDDFIKYLEERNKKSGFVLGSIQIIGIINDIAVKNGFKKCPCCGQLYKK